MKIIWTFLLLISVLFQMKAQILPLKFTTGIVRSDVHLSFSTQSIERITNAPYNTPKTGFHISIGSGFQFTKWFQLQTNFTYQERMPLETFHFPQQSGGFGSVVLSPVPSSPQSKGWNENKSNRLPNFKYRYLESIPMFNLSVKKIYLSAGIGLFFGELANRNQLVFTAYDFPTYASLFPSSLNSGEISYEKFDMGWIPKIEIFYALNSQTKLGISSQAYISHSRLINDVSNITPDDTLFDFDRSFYTTWIAYTISLSITHQFKF